jgi:hypothetical protein
MTYSVGGLIQAADYNGFVSTNVGANVNAIFGQAGTTTSGYGQGNIATVSAAAIVTATNWATLVNSVANIANHQGTSITSRSAPVAGGTISILAAVNSDIGNCYTNRNNAAASGTEIKSWTGNIAKLTATGSGTTTWTITFTHTLTWANNTAFNNYFNAGGLVRWETSKTADSTDADTEWNDLANTLTGNIYISGAAASKTIAGVAYTGTTKTGGTGTPTILATATGAYALTTSATTLYKQFADTAPYTGQFIQLNAAVNSNAAPTVITLTTTWVDPGGSGAGSSDNISGGTDTASPYTTFGTGPATLVTLFPPSTTYLTNTWGTPTIAATVV